jgi:hypothetical protein
MIHLLCGLKFKQLPLNGNKHIEEAMWKESLRCHGRHLVVEVKVKAGLSKMNLLFYLGKETKDFQ